MTTHKYTLTKDAINTRSQCAISDVYALMHDLDTRSRYAIPVYCAISDVCTRGYIKNKTNIVLSLK